MKTTNLVLTRRPNEALLIEPGIRVTVISIDGDGKVQLAVEAPQNIKVLREEAMDNPNSPDNRRLRGLEPIRSVNHRSRKPRP